MSKTSIHQLVGARARTLCFSLLAVAITMPRGCCLTPASASADAHEPAVVLLPLPPSAEVAGPPAGVAPPVAVEPTVAAEPPEVARLRAVRTQQAAVGAEIRRLHEEQRRLATEDRDRHPVTLPLITMGIGAGMAGVGLSLWFLSNLSLGHSSQRPSQEFQLKTLAVGASGGAIALTSLAVFGTRLNRRTHRAEVAALRLKRRELQRDMRRLERDAWSVLPDLSPTERRLGMSVRHAF